MSEGGGVVNSSTSCLIQLFFSLLPSCFPLGRSYNPAPYSLRDGSRQLRSLERLLLPEEAAAFFAVEPAVDARLNTPPPTAPPSPLPQGAVY